MNNNGINGKGDSSNIIKANRRASLGDIMIEREKWSFHTVPFISSGTEKSVLSVLFLIGLPYILIFPDMSSFSRVILASGRNFQNRHKCPEIGLKHFNFYSRATFRSEKSIAIVKKFDFDYLWISILHQSLTLKKCFLKKCPFICPSVSVRVAEHYA